MLRLPRLLLLVLLITSACQAGSLTPSPTATPLPLSENSAVISPTPSAAKISPTPFSPSPTFTPRLSFTSTSTSAAPIATPTNTALPITTLLFTGVIVPARCVQAALDELGNPDYPYEEVSEIISTADIAVGVYNATMSDRVERTGCMWTYQLVGGPENADALARAGFDVMSVATNHIKDCGLMMSWCDDAFFDTLENLRRVGVMPVGAGADLEEALEPVVITVNGIRFGFVSLGDSKMDPVVFAGEDHPGIALLEEGNMRAAVAAARQVSDVVIALPHWGSEDILLPNWNQLTQASYSVAAGADLVVGNHTHVIQPFQEIDGVLVFYGLGNFVFDQGLRDHRQGLILLVRFEGFNFAGYELIPTHVDPDGRVHIADPEEAAEILLRFEEASQVLE